MSKYNDKQKALMYDVLIKLVEFRNQVEEHIENPLGHRVTPLVNHVLRVDNDYNNTMGYDVCLDLDSRYVFALFWIFVPDENGESVAVCYYDSEKKKFNEDLERFNLDELSKLLDENVDKAVNIANNVVRWRRYSDE